MEEKMITEKCVWEGVVFLLDRRMHVSEDDWRLEQIYNLVQTICLHGEPVTFDKVKIVFVTSETKAAFDSNKEMHLFNVTCESNVDRVVEDIGDSKVVFTLGRVAGEVGEMLRTWRGTSHLVFRMNRLSHFALVKAISKINAEDMEKVGLSFDFEYKMYRKSGIDFVDKDKGGNILRRLEYSLVKHASGWSRTVDVDGKTVYYQTPRLPGFSARVEFQHFVKVDIGYGDRKEFGRNFTLLVNSNHRIYIKGASAENLILNSQERDLGSVFLELMECIMLPHKKLKKLQGFNLVHMPVLSMNIRQNTLHKFWKEVDAEFRQQGGLAQISHNSHIITFVVEKPLVSFEDRNKKLNFSDVKGDMPCFKVNAENWTLNGVRGRVKHVFEKAKKRLIYVKKNLNIA